MEMGVLNALKNQAKWKEGHTAVKVTLELHGVRLL